MKTSELTGAALDWAVAKCEGVREMSYEYNSGFSDGLGSANQKIAELTKQRDELLAALGTIIKDDSHNPTLMVMIAQEAVDNVKGDAV